MGLTSRLVIILGLFILSGCATVPDPAPPNLAPSRDATEARWQSTIAAERSVIADLERLNETYDSLQKLTEQSAESELPISLLRLVSMNCLNTEYGDGISGGAGLDGTSLSCRPAHFDRLQTALADAPTADQDLAMELLTMVDQVRILRGSLRMRLARLPRTITEHREFIAEERAMLRQLESDLARRRTLYSSQGWRDVTQLIADHRVLLREFGDHLDALAEAYPAWPADVDTLVSQIYFDLSDMRH